MKSLPFQLFEPTKHSSLSIPQVSGNYLICLRKEACLPIETDTVKYKSYQSLEVIYTGVSNSNLRTRDYKDHFIGNNAGRSTLRKSLGSLFAYSKIPRDKIPNGKTKFRETDEKSLTAWMLNNLVMFYLTNETPNVLEDELITLYNPPLNLQKNKNPVNKEFRKWLKQLRKP